VTPTLNRSASDSTPTRLGALVCRRGGTVACCCSGTLKGLDSERAIAWRAADSLSVRGFLGLELHEAPPDHSTVSRTRRLIDVETHQALFTWVLQRLAEAKLVKGKTIGIDADTGSQCGTAHRASGFFFQLRRRRRGCDVLIHPKQVRRVILRLRRRQPRIIVAVRGL
jgi:hypothetical protein